MPVKADHRPPSPYDDAELAIAAARGDRGAFAAIYDRYADRIFGLAVRRLRDREAAADVTQETFLVAAQRLGALRDPHRLRPWLFAVARNAMVDHVRRAAPLVSDEDMDVATHDMTSAEALAGIRAHELRDLLEGAEAGLDDRDRLVLDLTYREELAGADLADALGVRQDHVHQLLSRARRRLETSLGALLVARQGRDDCAELGAVLVGWDGRFSPVWRKRVARHVESCDVCARLRAVALSPASLAAAMPVAVAPPELRDHVLAGFDVMVARGTDSSATPAWAERIWRGDGFPDVVGRPRSRVLVAVVAGAAALLVIGGGSAIAALSADDPAPVVVAASPTSTDTQDAENATGGLKTVGSTSTPATTTPATPTTSTSASSSTVTESSTPTTPTPPPTPTTTSVSSDEPPPRTTTPTATTRSTADDPPPTTDPVPTITTTVPLPPPGDLSASVFSNALGVPRPRAGTFTLTNSGGTAVTWRAVASVDWLMVKPAKGGDLAPGESVEIGVSVDPALTAWPGEPVETVTVRGDGNGPEVVRIPSAG